MEIDLRTILATHGKKSSGDPETDALAKENPWEKTPPVQVEEETETTLHKQLKDSLDLLGCEVAKPEADDKVTIVTTLGPDKAIRVPVLDMDKALADSLAMLPLVGDRPNTSPPVLAAPYGNPPALSKPVLDAGYKAIAEDDEFGDYEAQEISTTGDRTVQCQFITGAAGCGKTFSLKQKIEEDPTFAILCATTGIAGVNLGSTTINSLLGYFDTESLNELFLTGRLTRKLAELSKQYQNLALDEVSMMDGVQLDTLRRAAQDVADNYTSVKHPIGIILTGDFCQLPPVKAKWAFDAQCWPDFEKNMTRLTKYWRQTDEKFLNGINAIRSGDGKTGVDWLKQTSVEFRSGLDMEFQGTTIVSKNVAVDRYNFLALQKVQGPDIKVAAARWGKQRGEWKIIPDELHVKVGAYVMILSNDSPHFTYANGDCGHIVEYDKTRRNFHIKLVRTGDTVCVPYITRTFEQSECPDDVANPPTWDPKEWFQAQKVFKVEGRRKYGLGQVQYPPIRLAYAATVHKTQGLSLDRVQMDVRDGFFGSPSMVYVSLSRARTPEGLRIIGSPETLIGRTKIAPEVLRWL